MGRKLLSVGAAALAVAGGGAAIAATTGGSPQEESKAVVEDAAKQLGVTPSRLNAALKRALENRVDAAVADGRITEEQGDAIKARIEAQDYPLLGFGMARHGRLWMHRLGHLDAAASYLGVAPSELRTQLQSGKTLADVAKAKDRSVEGLVSALVAAEKKKLDAAVASGRITQEQADRFLSSAKQRLTDLVNGRLPERGRGPFGGPPPGATGFDFRHDHERPDGPI